MDRRCPSVLDLKYAKELKDDFNNDVFSLVCGVVDDPHEIALAAREGTRGESECRLPSGTVSDAETPPVTVEGVDRPIQPGGVVLGYGKRDAGARRVENIHSGGRVTPREEGCWVEMGAVLQV